MMRGQTRRRIRVYVFQLKNQILSKAYILRHMFFGLGDRIEAFSIALGIRRKPDNNGNEIQVFEYPNPNPDFFNCLNFLVVSNYDS